MSDPYKIQIEPQVGLPTLVETKSKAGALIILPGIQTSPDVKSFRVFSKNGAVDPEHFSMSKEFFHKWRV